MIYDQKGRPKKTENPLRIEYQIIDLTLVKDLVEDTFIIHKAKLGKKRFILATNQLDKEELPDQELFSTYKEQSDTESGFKSIKDNTLKVDSIFLKKPTQISAISDVLYNLLLPF